MTGNILFLLVVLISWAVLIFLSVKGKMRLASFLSLIRMSLGPLILGLICVYSLPTGKMVRGEAIPQVPIIVFCLLIFFSILSLKSVKKSNVIPSKKPPLSRWFLFVSGVILQLTGTTIVFLSFYSPQILGAEEAIPQTGVWIYFGCTFISCLLLYVSSKLNSADYPNLFRWMVFFTIFLMFDQTTIISLILIYAFPSPPSVIYPYLSGLNTISFLPHGLVILLLVRGYIFENKAVS